MINSLSAYVMDAGAHTGQCCGQVAAAREQSAELQITLPDGSTKAAVKGVTTPLDIANQLSKSLAKKVVVADVDGGKWDLFRPLERDCRMQLFTFDDAKGKDVSISAFFI